VMRTSLLPGLLEALGRAERHGRRHRLFTVGACFLERLAGAPQRAEPRPPAATWILRARVPGRLAARADLPPARSMYTTPGRLQLVERSPGNAPNRTADSPLHITSARRQGC
jgi:hypothetical protein